MNFENLCEFFETIRKCRNLSERQQTTREFFKTIRQNSIQCYQTLRLILPKLDRDRQAYRIKEFKIIRLLIKMLNLPNGNDKNLLQKASTLPTRDFGETIYTVLKKYISSRKTILTIDQINDYLDRIANRTSDNALDDLILEIFHKLSSIGTKWLIQILLKDLKLGITDTTILNCYHEDGGLYYNINNNLRKLCETLSDPSKKLHELEVQIFEPFRPMLSKRCDEKNFNKCFPDTKTFIIENKFDGERFQLHMENGNFKYFSRKGYDFTDTFGNTHNTGLLTPLLVSAFDDGLSRVILDGEMMLWNKKLETFGCKGMKYDVKKLAKTSLYQPCFCVFDILLYNDEILTNRPLKVRLDYLKRAIKNPIDGVIVRSQIKMAKKRQDIIDALNNSVDCNEEGIIVKDPNSIYRCSERNCGWYKLKMEYFDDGVVEDLDLLMMGGSYGTNKKINSFIVGISSGPQTYLALSRIGSGLTDEQVDLLTKKLLEDGCSFSQFTNKTTGKLQFGRDTPDLYIEPDKSILLKVRATELVRSTNDYVKTPYTLRFPRVIALHSDKPTDECLTMNELLELTRQNKSVIKLHKRHLELDDISKKTSTNNRKRRKITMATIFNPNTYENLDGLLVNKKIHVLPSTITNNWKIEDIYIVIKRAGGELVYNLQPDVDIVLISKMNQKSLDLIEQNNKFDIIHTNWLRKVVNHKRLLPYEQEDVFKIGQNFKNDLADNVDRFGDSFTVETTVDKLKSTFNLMNEQKYFVNCNNTIQFDEKLFKFENYFGYFDCFERINDVDSKKINDSLIDQIQFRYYKGCVSQKLDDNVNLVVLYDENRRNSILEFLNNLGRGETDVQIVNKSFLYDFN